MELNIAVVDDNASDSLRLRSFLRTWSESGTHSISNIDSYSCGEEFIRAFIPGTVNIVFMDIIMGNISGIDTAARIRRLDPELLIIFLTTSKDFAFEAFPVHAFDYIIKPCTKKNVERVMNEAARLLNADEPEITLKVSRTEYQFPARSIISAVSQNHNVEINLADGRCITASMRFRDAEDIFMKHECFLLCNRGIIVNMSCISAMDNGVFIMKNGVRYPIRIRGRADVVSAFSQYLISHMKARA